MVLPYVAQHGEYLVGELAGGSNDERAEPVHARPSPPVQQLQHLGTAVGVSRTHRKRRTSASNVSRQRDGKDRRVSEGNVNSEQVRNVLTEVSWTGQDREMSAGRVRAEMSGAGTDL